MPAHPHADLMLQYAQDAQETDTPWEWWEKASSLLEWGPLHAHPQWRLTVCYRRKPRTIRIGEHDVPEPERNPPKKGQAYYTPALTLVSQTHITCVWEDDVPDKCFLARGLVHLTAEAAKQHARALIALTAQPRE